MKGRGIEKSFLYCIVSNKLDSLDVDKFDYLQRDSAITTVSIPFNQVKDKKLKTKKTLLQAIFGRIRDYMDVKFDNRVGYSRITYGFKVKEFFIFKKICIFRSQKTSKWCSIVANCCTSMCINIKPSSALKQCKVFLFFYLKNFIF